jgi:hypothetical protein
VTTRINITVDQNGLLDQVANQTRANHEALVIQQEQKKTEETASKELTEKRRSLGQDVKTGEPLPITPPSSGGFSDINGNNRVKYDPAASRAPLAALLAAPFVYADYGGSHSGLNVRCRGNRNVPASRFSYEENKAYPEGVVVAGPAGTSALEPAQADRPVGVIVSGQRQDNGEFLTFTDYRGESPEFPTLLIAYAVQNGVYETVLNWAGPGTPNPEPPYNVISLAGSEVPVSGFKPLSRIRQFTHEFIMRMPVDGFNDTDPVAYTTAGNAPYLRAATMSVNFGGFSIGTQASEQWIGAGGFMLDTFEPAPFGGTIQILVNKLTRIGSFGIRWGIFPTEIIDGQSEGSTFELPGVGPGDFVHYALTRYSAEGGFRWVLHINGTTVLSGIQDPSNWSNTYGTQPPSVRIGLQSLRTSNSPPVIPAMAFCASRFTSRALYLNNFTPPSSITSFA